MYMGPYWPQLWAKLGPCWLDLGAQRGPKNMTTTLRSIGIWNAWLYIVFLKFSYDVICFSYNSIEFNMILNVGFL